MKIGRTKALRIAFNMLVCAIAFAPAKPWPRETISGLVGRKCYESRHAHRGWSTLRRFIDWLHRKYEPDHCGETATMENSARRKLGYHD